MWKELFNSFKMRKKEELGYGMIILFVLVSLFFITLMVPFDTVTSAVVFDVSQEELDEGLKNVVYSAPMVHFAVIAILATFIVGGSLSIIQQKREAEELLDALPRMNRIELREYVRESLEKGFKKEDIGDMLINEGWDKAMVDAVLRLF